MASKEPSLDLIYNTLLEIKAGQGKLEAKVESHANAIKDVASSHYKLKDDYTKHKSKLFLVASGIALLISSSLTAAWNYLTKHN
jgi:hypothetical protein